LQMRFELSIAFRYLMSRRREKFISLISWISIFGVAVGVMALIVVLAVMSGFDNDLKEKIIGTNSHLVVESTQGITDYAALEEKINAIDGVVATAPFINGPVMIKHPNGVFGVLVRGIDPIKEARVTELAKYIKNNQIEIGTDQLILGQEAARRLMVREGDPIKLVSSTTGRIKEFTISGIYASGMYEYDANLLFAGLEDIKKLLKSDFIDGIGVRVKNPDHAKQMARTIQREIGYPYYARSWMDMNKNLFFALKLEKITMFIILALIVLVACFNIASTLIMLVMEKTKDIAILKAIGATRKQIRKIFIVQGVIFGVFGTVLGAAAGLLLCQLLKHYQFIKLPRDIYYGISKLPILIKWDDIIIIIVSALFISLIATVYPAHQASRFEPSAGLRYE